MKRILYIAPHSFPIKSSESICNSKVAYALAQAGYQVDVYTCSDPSTYPADLELNEQLSHSPNLTIETILPKYILLRSNSVWDNIKSLLFNIKILLTTSYYYNGISVSYLIAKTVERKIKEYGTHYYDAMITRGYLTDFAGVYLSKKYGIKWIANWNDPYPVKKFPSPYGKGYNARLPYFMNRLYNDIQKYATIHTFPNSRLRDYMLKCFTNVSKDKTHVIPHMALSAIKAKKDSHRSDKLRIVHCGSAKKPRNPINFLYALRNIKEEGHANFECFFIGDVDQDVIKLTEELGLTNFVRFLSSMNYKQSTDFLSSCDISLVIEAICEEGIYLPTKVVDAFQSGVPLFCVSPSEGVLKDIISTYGCGYYADNKSVGMIYHELLNMIMDYNKGNLPVISKENLSPFFEDSIIQTFKKLI